MKEKIGERIKRLRLERGMSADALGKKIGKGKSSIYRYENGEIEDMPYTILLPLAKALHTTPDYLIGYDEIMETINSYGISNYRQGIIDKINYLSEDGLKELSTYVDYLLAKESK